MKNTFPAVLLFALTLSGALPAQAHEFWLEPNNFTPNPGTKLSISLLNGQFFKGDSFPYVREESKKFVVADPRGERPVKGIDGDDPAASLTLTAPGLAIFAYHGTQELLSFENLKEFEAYLKFEGLEHILPLHQKQGKPAANIKEAYARCAKLLVNVGEGAGEDRLIGMPLELVAERNPYKVPAGESFPVRLFFNGKPIEGVLVSAISKADPKNRQIVRTDREGRAALALPQSGPWLLNAVHMMESQARDKAHWTSLWASMTFARP